MTLLTNSCRSDVIHVGPLCYSLFLQISDVFCTSSLAVFPTSCNQLSGKFRGHSWGGINSGVSFSHNSLVTRVLWIFQVSQGSVRDIQVRLKCAPFCSIFIQETEIFRGYYKNIIWSFYAGHSVCKTWLIDRARFDVPPNTL